MIEAAAGFFKIFLFLTLGLIFNKTGTLNNNDVNGIKKVIINIAIPAVLFVSFSNLHFDINILPITITIIGLNLILFGLGILFYKLGGSTNRLLPMVMATMNFGLLGLPLFDAVYGIDKLHHYTMFGVGNEIFMWFIFYFLLRWFLGGGVKQKGRSLGFIKSPIIWGIVLGCLFSILGIDIFSSSNFVVLGISKTVKGAAALTTPLILLFIGFNISLSADLVKESIKYIIIRLLSGFAVGFLLKILVLDKFIEPSHYYDTAYFLLISLPAVFSVPILAADYVEERELTLLNNIIVFHAIITIFLFALYTFVGASSI